MNWTLTLIFFTVCCGLLWSGMRGPGAVYQYPFLAGATFFGFVLPQMPALASDAHLPEGAFAQAAFFTILCAVACQIGWDRAQRPVAMLRWDLDERRLARIAAVLSLAGSFFYYKLSTLPEEVLSATQYSGAPVAYIFLGKMLSYGLYLAVFCLSRRRSGLAIAVVLFGGAIVLHRIIVGGRRGDIVELLLVVTLFLWFVRGVAVPRAAALAGVLLAVLALYSTGDYRAATTGRDGPKWSELSKIDVTGNLSNALEHGGHEMRNAVLRISSADRLGAFDFGLFHWNTLVFNFVPAQIFGADFKAGFQVWTPVSVDRDYDPWTGSTETGMADAFASFWYFGCLKFFAIAYLMGRLYRTAATGSAAAQVIYAVSVAQAMHAITHHTQWIFSTWIHMAIFLLPGLALARKKISRRLPRRLVAATCSASPTNSKVRR